MIFRKFRDKDRRVRGRLSAGSGQRAEFCVVGPGPRFLSGMTYHTYGLATLLAAESEVSLVTMRKLLPRWLYPGARRVGAPLSRVTVPANVNVFDGVDWYWWPSIVGLVRSLRRNSPETVILQWWTGTVLHSFLLVTVLAKALCHSAVVLEVHEAQDVGEAGIPVARWYVRCLLPLLLRHVDGYVFHNEHDLATLSRSYCLKGPRTIIHFPAWSHYAGETSITDKEDDKAATECRFLYFGVIRPFKGVEDLVEAFGKLKPVILGHSRLSIVGEVWQNWRAPERAVEASPAKSRITFIDRYVTDEEVHALFSDADVVVLPYHRSSQSGPLHVAFGYGLPVVVSDVGGLREAASEYAGTIFCEPGHPGSIAEAMEKAYAIRGQRFEAPRDETAVRRDYRALAAVIHGRG